MQVNLLGSSGKSKEQPEILTSSEQEMYVQMRDVSSYVNKQSKSGYKGLLLRLKEYLSDESFMKFIDQMKSPFADFDMTKIKTFDVFDKIYSIIWKVILMCSICYLLLRTIVGDNNIAAADISILTVVSLWIGLSFYAVVIKETKTYDETLEYFRTKDKTALDILFLIQFEIEKRTVLITFIPVVIILCLIATINSVLFFIAGGLLLVVLSVFKISMKRVNQYIDAFFEKRKHD